MSENKDEIVKKWFKKANNDIKNIENNLLAEDIPLDTICFHAQQAIEKYFKGSLIYFEQDIYKSHDLVRLLTDVTKFIPELSVFEEKLEKISEFAVQVRYPDSFFEPSKEDAKESYKIALEIKEIILKKLNMEDN